jgi:hypothetical protein
MEWEFSARDFLSESSYTGINSFTRTQPVLFPDGSCLYATPLCVAYTVRYRSEVTLHNSSSLFVYRSG